jgi:NADH:ubiquinone oxidoreductase subunit 2 (subunit N)
MTEDMNQLYYRCIIKNTVQYYDYWTIFSLFVMIGVPPLVGFFIKFGAVLTFISTMDSLAVHTTYEGLFTIFLCYSLLSSFYYLRLIKQLLVGWKIMAHARSGMTYLKSSSKTLQILRYLFFLASINIFIIIKIFMLTCKLIFVTTL